VTCFRPDDDAEEQQPCKGEVRGEYPGNVIEGGGVRACAQNDQRDRRHADQHQEQQNRPAAQRRVPDSVTEPEQTLGQTGVSRLN
jgi:hypothetical protein